MNPRNPKKAVFAAKVTLEGGQKVTAEDTREYPDRSQRFAGTVEWFNKRKGFGFIKPKESFNFDGVDFDAEKKGTIYFAKEDIRYSGADGSTRGPSVARGKELEFVLYKKTTEDEKKGTQVTYGAGEITNVGGTVLGEDDFIPLKTPEERKEARKKFLKKKKKAAAKKRKANQLSQLQQFPKGFLKQLKKQQKQQQQMAKLMGGFGGFGDRKSVV